MTDVNLPEPVAFVAQFCGEWRETNTVNGQPIYTAAQMLAIHEQGRLAGLAEAAHEAERIATEQRSAFKGRTEPIDRDKLYNPHTDGMSDGAFEVAEAIRSLAASDGGK